jgi:hypothetical protein
MNCADLRAWAREHRYHWRYEESRACEVDRGARADDPWYAEVPCRRGTLYPLGGDLVAAHTSTQGMRAKLLAVDSRVTVHQSGDHETVVRFPSGLLDAVAKVLRPRRLRGRAGFVPSVETRSKGLAAIGTARGVPPSLQASDRFSAARSVGSEGVAR